jgi:Predicted periplasmic ligand-binding sensor domain
MEKGTLYNINNSALPSNDIYALATDTDKSIWIATACGLANYNNGKWKIYGTDNSPLLSNTILSLAVDSRGILWAGTNKGITAIKGNRFRSFTSQNSNLIDNRIQTIVVHADKLYVGTQLGLAILDLKSFSL